MILESHFAGWLGAEVGHDRAELDDGVLQCGAKLEEDGRDLVLPAKLPECFTHLSLYESGAKQTQNAIVNSSRQRMGCRHATYRDWTAVGAIPCVMA